MDSLTLPLYLLIPVAFSSRATHSYMHLFLLVHVLGMFAKVQMDYAIKIW